MTTTAVGPNQAFRRPARRATAIAARGWPSKQSGRRGRVQSERGGGVKLGATTGAVAADSAAAWRPASTTRMPPGTPREGGGGCSTTTHECSLKSDGRRRPSAAATAVRRAWRGWRLEGRRAPPLRAAPPNATVANEATWSRRPRQRVARRGRRGSRRRAVDRRAAGLAVDKRGDGADLSTERLHLRSATCG